jgi:polyhydroxyalkanoate synthesis regulator phasin
MIGHIYGKENLLNKAIHRPHVFVNEIELNVKYLKNHIQKITDETIEQKNKFVESYKSTLNEGIAYYKNLLESIKNESADFLENMKKDLFRLEEEIAEIAVREEVLV